MEVPLCGTSWRLASRNDQLFSVVKDEEMFPLSLSRTDALRLFGKRKLDNPLTPGMPGTSRVG